MISYVVQDDPLGWPGVELGMEMGRGGWSPEMARKEREEGDLAVDWAQREAEALLSSRDKGMRGDRKGSTVREGEVWRGGDDDPFRSVQVAFEASLKPPNMSAAIN